MNDIDTTNVQPHRSTNWSRVAEQFVQLLTLLVGIGLGYVLGSRKPDNSVEAAQSQTATPAPDQSNATRPIPVQPTLGAPTIGANLILVHQLEADVAVVNGFNLLKIDEGIINYLATHGALDPVALNAVVSNAREKDTHTIGPPTVQPAPKSAPTPQSEKK